MSGAGPTILVVEDEPQMRRFIRSSLASNGYKVLEAEKGSEAVTLITSWNPDVILLDLGLPDGDGIELTKKIREWNKAPIIVISARGRESDKVESLDAGADDYVTKPFGVNELLARLRVALRRAKGEDSRGVTAHHFGPLQVDLVRREVRVDGKEVHLTPTEYKLLTYLAENAGKVLTHRQILQEVWGPAYTQHAHYVRVQMGELRKKIEKNPARPELLTTEPGVGYRLRDLAPGASTEP